MTSSKTISFAFFGTGALAESVLAALVRSGYIPSLVVTKPDSKQGRHMVLTAPYIKTWAEMKGIPVYQPETLRDLPNDSPLHTIHYDVYIVASYGKLIPEDILLLPQHGVLNVHPSLLPLYRGASPIESVLLEGDMNTGVTIIKLDKEMDHGPILVQSAYQIPFEATTGSLEVSCGQLGGELLVSVLESYCDGVLIPKEQDHTRATFCKKITKEMGEITLTTQADIVQRKFRACTPWPSVYFFIQHKEKTMRVKVTSINLVTTFPLEALATDVILSVIPEGKNEMDWKSFERGYLGK
jgi:methionyl-tRNA formyltransferase